MQKPLSLPATCRAASSELRRSASAQVAHRNGKQQSVQTVHQTVDVKELWKPFDSPSYYNTVVDMQPL
jgi:hypothetical protein